MSFSVRGAVPMRRVISAVAVLFATTILWAAPKNIILMIGDGMGPDVVKAAAAYQYGKDAAVFGGTKLLPIQTLANHAYATTFPFGGSYDFTWKGGNPAYITGNPTDSAAAATALATGTKTYNAAIAVDVDKKPLKSIVQYAQERGMKTGIVTTKAFVDATPGGFGGHAESRKDYTIIAHDMLFNVQPDVVMGAGNPAAWDKVLYEKYSPYLHIAEPDMQAIIDGKTPYTLIQKREEFQKLITDPAKGKVLGLFMTFSIRKPLSADLSTADPAVPTLPEMAQGTLNTLANPTGFFVMIEGALIDEYGHKNSLTNNIGESVEFNQTISTVLEWIKNHGGWEQNLLIITADHDTGYLNSVQPTEAGKLPEAKWNVDNKGWGGHTNRIVDVYYQGAGGEAFTQCLKTQTDTERGQAQVMDNTDIFKVMKAALPETVPAVAAH